MAAKKTTRPARTTPKPLTNNRKQKAAQFLRLLKSTTACCDAVNWIAENDITDFAEFYRKCRRPDYLEWVVEEGYSINASREHFQSIPEAKYKEMMKVIARLAIEQIKVNIRDSVPVLRRKTNQRYQLICTLIRKYVGYGFFQEAAQNIVKRQHYSPDRAHAIMEKFIPNYVG